jgi:hypothetical protein
MYFLLFLIVVSSISEANFHSPQALAAVAKSGLPIYGPACPVGSSCDCGEQIRIALCDHNLSVPTRLDGQLALLVYPALGAIQVLQLDQGRTDSSIEPAKREAQPSFDVTDELGRQLKIAFADFNLHCFVLTPRQYC